MGLYTRSSAPVGNPGVVNPGAGAQQPGMNIPDLGPGVVMGGGPAPIQRSGVGSVPRPIIGPAPRPLPQLPYGGPIGMPGGQMPGPGMQVPVDGLPTNGQGGGKGMGFNPGMQQQMPGQMPGGPQMGFGFDPDTGLPFGPQAQPGPDFATALGTASPLLNTLQR